MSKHPWPDTPEQTEQRVRAVVASVVPPEDLLSVSLRWIEREERPVDGPHRAVTALELAVRYRPRDQLRCEIWGADWHYTWDEQMEYLAVTLADVIADRHDGI